MQTEKKKNFILFHFYSNPDGPEYFEFSSFFSFQEHTHHAAFLISCANTKDPWLLPRWLSPFVCT